MCWQSALMHFHMWAYVRKFTSLYSGVQWVICQSGNEVLTTGGSSRRVRGNYTGTVTATGWKGALSLTAQEWSKWSLQLESTTGLRSMRQGSWRCGYLRINRDTLLVAWGDLRGTTYGLAPTGRMSVFWLCQCLWLRTSHSIPALPPLLIGLRIQWR